MIPSIIAFYLLGVIGNYFLLGHLNDMIGKTSNNKFPFMLIFFSWIVLITFTSVFLVSKISFEPPSLKRFISIFSKNK